MQTKKCSICGIEKSKDDFFKHIRNSSGYHPECKKCFTQKVKEYRIKNRDKVNANSRKYMKQFREKDIYIRYMEKYKPKYLKDVKTKVFSHYGNGKIFCNCCGEQEFKFLTIDHINNDGAKHRQQINGKKRTGAGLSFYVWIHKNNYPKDLQVLCMNCNFGKRMNNGICPHNKK